MSVANRVSPENMHWRRNLPPREPHKRLPISKNISKNFLEIFLEIAMLYGTGIFRGSNKKEPKTLVNTGVSASFIVFYHRTKSVIFRLVIVP